MSSAGSVLFSRLKIVCSRPASARTTRAEASAQRLRMSVDPVCDENLLTSLSCHGAVPCMPSLGAIGRTVAVPRGRSVMCTCREHADAGILV